MPEEFIVLTRKDSNLIKNSIFKRENYTRTTGEEYYFDMSINLLKKNLQKNVNHENQIYIESLLSQLKTNESPLKPNVDWGSVFEVCQTCFFGTYPADRFTYFNFSLIFMSEEEIREMINYENGEQWKYALMAIKAGDSFTLEKNSEYGDDVIDRRIASFIIKKWEDCKIPEIKKLIETFKIVM